MGSKKDHRAFPTSPLLTASGVTDSNSANEVLASNHSGDQSHTGLGAAQLHPNEIRAIHDANAMAELRAGLDDLKIASAWTFERAEVIALLSIVAKVLDNSMEESVYVQHGAVGLLDRFIEALEDLNRGKVHRALLPARGTGANKALTAEERRVDQVLLASVVIVRRAKNHKTRSEAERYLARTCQKAGLTRRGKKITAQMLKSLRDHPKKTPR
jgi:hypothetical protein